MLLIENFVLDISLVENSVLIFDIFKCLTKIFVITNVLNKTKCDTDFVL